MMPPSRILHIVFLLLLWIGRNATAQAAAQNGTLPVTFSTLAVGQSISGLLYEEKGKTYPLYAEVGGLSQSYPRPKDGKFVIFRLVPPTPPETEPKRVNIANAVIGNEGPYLVLLAASKDTEAAPGGVAVQVLDDSWATHPLKTFRFLNFSKRNMAVQLGNATQVIPSGQSHVFPPQGDGVDFDFKVAVFEVDGWVLRLVSTQSIVPRTRATAIIADIIPTPEVPHPVDINVFTFYDSNQPPRP